MQRLFHYHYLYLLPLMLSAIFSLTSFRLNWPRPYRLFSAFLFITLFTEAFAIAWKWHWHNTTYWHYNKSNLWIYNGMHIVRYTCLLLFYSRIFESPATRNTIQYFVLFFACFGITEYMFIHGPHQMNSYTLILTNIFCILLSLAFFRQVLKEKTIITLGAHPMTWISLGTFIYYSASLPYFIFFNHVYRQNPNMAISLMYINHALNIFMYTTYLIAFLCKPYPQK